MKEVALWDYETRSSTSRDHGTPPFGVELGGPLSVWWRTKDRARCGVVVDI